MQLKEKGNYTSQTKVADAGPGRATVATGRVRFRISNNLARPVYPVEQNQPNKPDDNDTGPVLSLINQFSECRHCLSSFC